MIVYVMKSHGTQKKIKKRDKAIRNQNISMNEIKNKSIDR